MSMTIVKNWVKVFFILGAVSAASGCASYNKEKAKEKSTEQRKQELCRDISTRDLSHCTGNHVPPPPFRE